MVARISFQYNADARAPRISSARVAAQRAVHINEKFQRRLCILRADLSTSLGFCRADFGKILYVDFV